MKIKQAIEVLTAHNEWRRGQEIDMQDPTMLGIAIDTAVEFMESFLLDDEEFGQEGNDE